MTRCFMAAQRLPGPIIKSERFMITDARAAEARYLLAVFADMFIMIRQKLASAVLADSSGYLANCKLHRCGSDTVHRTTALNFLNQSRSYDATLRAVRFCGHDGTMEVSFYVNEDALKRIQPGIASRRGRNSRRLRCESRRDRHGCREGLSAVPQKFLWAVCR
jgi:hypothetical protein